MIRVTRPVPADFVDTLATEFQDIITDGGITERDALRAEREETEILHLPRLVLHFDRVHFGRLRMLIDRLNQAPTA